MIRKDELNKRIRDIQLLITKCDENLDIQNYGMVKDYIVEARKEMYVLQIRLTPKKK